MKYSSKKTTKQELEKFADKIEKLVRKEQMRKDVAELKVSSALTKGRKSMLGRFSQIESEKEKKKHLMELMAQEEDALKKDMEIAKNIYHRILTSYYRLPPKDRKEVYIRLNSFYEQVNKMLFSSFYSKQSKKQLGYFTKKLEELHKEAEKVIAKEKVAQIHERSAERLKLPELKPVSIHEKPAIKKERAIKTEELKKLEQIEKAAKERIKNIAESVVNQRILEPINENREEKTIMKEIKYVPINMAEKQAAKPMVYEIRQEVHAKPKQTEHIKIREAKPAKKTGHAPAMKKEIVGNKSKKFMRIAKEEKEIREKLSRLGSYGG